MAGDELLDVLDAAGRPTGRRKTRRDVHRDGDWHRCFHLWVVRGDGVLFQRRAARKGMWPSMLDATAAGHLVAGEVVADGLREVAEELGVSYAIEQLTDLGEHTVDEPRRNGGRNRERQSVFGVRDERRLEAWTNLDDRELDGLVLVGHDAFAALAAGLDAHAWPARAWDGTDGHDITVTRADVVPAPYLPRIAPALARLVGR